MVDMDTHYPCTADVFFFALVETKNFFVGHSSLNGWLVIHSICVCCEFLWRIIELHISKFGKTKRLRLHTAMLCCGKSSAETIGKPEVIEPHTRYTTKLTENQGEFDSTVADWLITQEYLVERLSCQHWGQVHGFLFIWIRQKKPVSFDHEPSQISDVDWSCTLSLKAYLIYLNMKCCQRTCLLNRTCNVTFRVLKKHWFITSNIIKIITNYEWPKAQ